MKVAIIGSRNASKSKVYLILENLPKNTSEIVSGGAKGVDFLAEIVADSLSIPLKIFLPDYESYGKLAPLKRNDEIIEYADTVIAFWDGKSKGTGRVISDCILKNKSVKIIRI